MGSNQFWKLLDPHLDDTLLSDLSVDHIQIDLENETEQGGAYFLPMSQERIHSLNKRPEFAITFDPEESTSVWCYDDADAVHMVYRGQLCDSNDETPWNACDATQWRFRLCVLL